jgi:hypothetical protein
MVTSLPSRGTLLPCATAAPRRSTCFLPDVDLAGVRTPGRPRPPGRAGPASARTRTTLPVRSTEGHSRERIGPDDTGRDAALNVVTRRRRVRRPHSVLELAPPDEVEEGLTTEPARNSRGNPTARHRLLGDHVVARPDRRRPGKRPLEGLRATSSACTWLSTPSPRAGSESGSPAASRRHTSGLDVDSGWRTPGRRR